MYLLEMLSADRLRFMGWVKQSNPVMYIRCLNLLIGEKCFFGVFRPTATTTPMEGSLQLATSGSIVLDAMIKNTNPLLDTFYWFSQPQSPLPVAAKTAKIPQLFDVPRPQRGKRRDI